MCVCSRTPVALNDRGETLICFQTSERDVSDGGRMGHRAKAIVFDGHHVMQGVTTGYLGD